MRGVQHPPAVRRTAPARLPPPARFALPNGLPVLWAPRAGLPVVDVQFVVRTGAAADLPRLGGRTALAAALLDEGTARHSAPALAAALEYLGARLNSVAGWDGVTLALHVLTPRLGPALELLGEIAREPLFAPAELERKRAERLASIAQEAAEPGAIARDLFQHAVYGADHPFGVPLGGTPRTVAAIDRTAVTAWHAAHVHGGDAFIVVTGDCSPDTLLPVLDRAFAALPAGRAAEAPELPAPAQEGPRIFIADRPDAAQSEVRAGHAGPPRGSPEYFPLLVLNTVLGGAFTSRLNRVLREEKGYTYGARSAFAFRRGGGPFVASVAVATDATADTVREIVANLKRLWDEPVPEAELDRARNYLALGFPRRFEIGEDHASQIASAELHGLGPDYHSRFVDRVRSVDADAVQAAAVRYLQPGQLTVAVAGAAASIRAELEALDFGPVLESPAPPGPIQPDRAGPA